MAEGFGEKPTVTVGNPTKKSDFDAFVDFVSGSEVLDGDTGLTLVVADFGKTVRVNNAAAKTVALPSVSASNIGGMFCIFKLGAGNVTIQTADSDTINGGAASGTLICSTATQTWAYVILQLTSATGWTIKSGVGTWATSADIFRFGISKIAQVATDVYTTVETLATGIPYDDTVPQDNEGDPILSSGAFTPQNASSTIIITATINSRGTTGEGNAACLFSTLSSNALMTMSSDAGWELFERSMTWIESAASTNVRTYSVRVGSDTGEDIFMNDSPDSFYGSSMACTLSVMEVLP